MAKILSRPMFRKGGSTNNGIMTGLVNRKGYSNGTDWNEVVAGNPYIAEAAKAYGSIEQPKDKSLYNMLISGGLDLVSGQHAGAGVLSNVAKSFKAPSEAYMAAQAARGAQPSQMKMAAVQTGLEQKWKMDQLAKKQAADTKYQKDYTTDRKYYESYKDNMDVPDNKYSWKVQHIYPHAMAEFVSRIQDNAYKSEEGSSFMSQVDGIVPHEISNGKIKKWDYGKMDAGAYYYHPGLKLFVQRVPRTDEKPGHVIMIDPYTFGTIKEVPFE